jgi:hypothetical protein
VPTKEKATHPGTEVPPDDAASGTSPEGGADERTEGTADSAAGPGGAGAAEKTETWRAIQRTVVYAWVTTSRLDRGATTLIIGRPKMAGKSAPGSRSIRSVLAGEPFSDELAETRRSRRRRRK